MRHVGAETGFGRQPPYSAKTNNQNNDQNLGAINRYVDVERQDSPSVISLVDVQGNHLVTAVLPPGTWFGFFYFQQGRGT